MRPDFDGRVTTKNLLIPLLLWWVMNCISKPIPTRQQPFFLLTRRGMSSHTNSIMLKRTRKQGPEDVNEIAFRVVSGATGEKPEERPKNQAAVQLGRLGGLKGGKARAANLTPEQRSEIAQRAARVRWSRPDEQGEN